MNELRIYLTSTNPNKVCDQTQQSETKTIPVTLYNYDTEAYNNSVGLESGSLLIRSAWGNYKADGYEIDDNGNNAHNESCGDQGIFYGLVQSNMSGDASIPIENRSIQFTKDAKFFDNSFSNSVGEKYSNVGFEFSYDEGAKEYSYDSTSQHVHYDDATNTLKRYDSVGPGTLSDSNTFQRNGFFPFTDETDNMTDYGFGMRMDVEFYLTEDGTIDGETPMEFNFSGDDDVWIFIDGQLALDLGGIHARRGGTINFKDKDVTYDDIFKNGDRIGPPNKANGCTSDKPNTTFLESLEEGTHTLTMYYLERGGNESNCEIKFNLLVVNRQGTLNFEKQDNNEQSLEGAVFGLYETPEQIENETPIQEARSDSSGNVTFDISNLQEDDYFLKEIAAPFGYIADSNTYKVTVRETQNGTDITVNGTITDGDNNIVTAITNQKRTTGGGTTTVTVEKKWGSDVDKGQKVPVTVTLKGDNEIVPLEIAEENPVILDESDWTHTWENLPGSIDYTVEEAPVAGFEAEYDVVSEYTINQDFIRNEPDSTDSFTLGGNGIIIIKKGNTQYLWTAREISNDDKEKIVDAITNMGLKGLNKIDNPEFGYGDWTFNSIITIDFNADSQSVALDFLDDSARSLFWAGTYNETRTITITNDKVDTTDIPVEKIWGDSVGDTEKQSVEIGLYNGDELVKKVTLTGDPDWKGVFEEVPYWDQGTGEKIQYTVKEISIGDKPVEQTDFQVTVTENPDGSFTVTNEKLKPWQILKVSASDNITPLKEAIFKLEKDEPNSAIYYGKTGENGIVVWYTDRDCTEANKLEGAIPIGNYQLSEIQAPSGYAVSSITWTVGVASGGVTITEQDGGNLKGEEIGGVLTFTIANEAVYSLPSSGGPGIFLYTIGGVLLLMAGSLILYKMKRGEVLKK